MKSVRLALLAARHVRISPARPVCIECARILCALLFLIVAPKASAEATGEIPIAYAGRIVGDATSTRIFVDFDRRIETRRFFMDSPPRLVIETPKILFRLADTETLEVAGLVNAVRYGAVSADRSRIVLMLTGPAAISRFEVVDLEQGRYRLVADLAPGSAEGFAAEIAGQAREIGRSGGVSAKGDRVRPADKAPGRLVVVLDPGHGGIDGGATGAGGTREKDLTLKVARLIGEQIAAAGPFDVRFTRQDDVFVALSERVAFARRQHADLAISLHADSVRQDFVRGATVYTLSKSASDELAGELAHGENRSDLVAGMEADSTDDVLADILADLTARETTSFSKAFSRTLAGRLEKRMTMIKNPQRSAAFRVLRSGEVPAVLLEMGYLSNADDEKQMTDPVWQAALAEEVAQATQAFFSQRIR
jgi:N-acetylmuramoyl-L-alanine amidase